MRTSFFLASALLSAVFLAGCTQTSPSPSSNYMIMDEVKYVGEFPLTFSLQNKAVPKIDLIGIKSFVVYDSVMILSTSNKDGLWSFFSLPDYKYLGNFLTRGEGPLEFIEAPSVSNKVRLIKEKNMLFAYIYDSQKGKVLKMNIDEAIRKQRADLSAFKDSLPPFLFNFVMIDSSTFLCKKVNDNITQQIRYIDKDNEIKTPIAVKKLNMASIRQGEDINILSTITKFHPTNNRVVEMCIGLNYINIYSPDGSYSKTICIGKNLDNIKKIQDKMRWNRVYTFADLRLFDDFFGVVYINEDEKTYQINRKRFPSILLFDWQGGPLAELKLKHFITSFDIDFMKGELYTFDVHSDEFYKYGIKDILLSINK